MKCGFVWGVGLLRGCIECRSAGLQIRPNYARTVVNPTGQLRREEIEKMLFLFHQCRKGADGLDSDEVWVVVFLRLLMCPCHLERDMHGISPEM